MSTVDRIFQIIKENNLTAKEFAKITNLSPGNITDWKTGRAKPSLESLKKISMQFNVDIEWLIGKNVDKEYLKFDCLIYPSNFAENYCKNLPTRILYLIKKITVELLFESDNYIDTDLLEYYIKSDMSDYYIQNKYYNQAYDAIYQLYDYNKLFNKNLKEIQNTSTSYNKIQYNHTLGNSYHMCPVYGNIAAGQPNWAEECIEGYLPIDPNMMNIVDPEECYFLRVNGESMNKLIKNGAYALIRKADVVDDGDIAVVLVNGYDATLKRFSKQGDFIVLEPMSNDPTFTTQIYTKDTEIKVIGKYIGKMEMK